MAGLSRSLFLAGNYSSGPKRLGPREGRRAALEADGRKGTPMAITTLDDDEGVEGKRNEDDVKMKLSMMMGAMMCG